MALAAWRSVLSLGVVAACLFAAIYQHVRTSPRETPVAIISHASRPESSGQSPVCLALAAALPGRVYNSNHPAFEDSVTSYWSQNACELVPSCVVRPARVEEVAVAVKVLKTDFDATRDSSSPLRFVVRSGGHSPEAGFASIDGGVVVDMSLINEVRVSGDGHSVRVGVGARWADVSSRLDDLGLAIVGGRNSNVGVGGLVLGGGVSFFSPRYGMVCDNIDAYEIVLANGTVANVTSSEHGNLWRALKGGTGNFGIVTRVTAKTFVAGKIWAGYAFWTGWQTPRVLNAFAEFNRPENFDEYAAGPILVLSYVQNLGIRITVSSLAYTKPEKWPRVFEGFRSIWRVWSTLKVQSLTDATHELNRMAPAGQRQFQVTMTVKNDLDTFNEFNEIYTKKLKEVRGVKDSVWSFVLQPLSSAVRRKGGPNILGLETRPDNETLIIVLVSVSWSKAKDDKLVQRVSRDIITMCEEAAQRRGTADPYYYLNYAASGQHPINGYGEANKQFMKVTSKLYDPDGLFQLANHGGFKLF